MQQKTSLDVYKKILASGLISKRRKEIVEILWEHTALTGNQISKIHKERHNTNSFSENVKNRYEHEKIAEIQRRLSDRTN